MAEVCFIASHGGSADHFAVYAQELRKDGIQVEVQALGPAVQKFKDKGTQVQFSSPLENLDQLVNTVANNCLKSSTVIIDVGNEFDAKVLEILSKKAPHITRYAYYDNPEPYVPGGYSATAAKVMKWANGVLFANEKLATSKIYSDIGKEIDFTSQKRIGIGYYPVSAAEKIATRRIEERSKIRENFFQKAGLQDKGQQIFVYFGGNNEEYYNKAFPAFLSLLKEVDLRNTLFMIQQHPAAKDRDWNQVGKAPNVIRSQMSSDDAQVLADAAFYYQTSMGPQFVIGGIPTFQIGHEIYEDILIRNQLAIPITTASQFQDAIKNWEKNKPQKEVVLKNLGIRSDWLNVLKNAISQKVSFWTPVFQRKNSLAEIADNVLYFGGKSAYVIQDRTTTIKDTAFKCINIAWRVVLLLTIVPFLFFLIVKAIDRNRNEYSIEKTVNPKAVLYLSITGNPTHLGHMAVVATAIHKLGLEGLDVEEARISLSDQGYLRQKTKYGTNIPLSQKARIHLLEGAIAEANRREMFKGVPVKFWNDQDQGFSDHPDSYRRLVKEMKDKIVYLAAGIDLCYSMGNWAHSVENAIIVDRNIKVKQPAETEYNRIFVKSLYPEFESLSSTAIQAGTAKLAPENLQSYFEEQISSLT